MFLNTKDLNTSLGSGRRKGRRPKMEVVTVKRLLTITVVTGLFFALAAPAGAVGGPLMRPATWVDGELFNGVVTPATFDPANGNFDELYAGCNFKDDATLISESGPGDQDYNGGRWHLNVIDPEANCADYADADGVDDLNLGDFISTSMYFQCPLLPSRGNA